MWVQQYGVHLDTQAYKHQCWRQAYSSKIIDVRVENIRIVASATAHQNKAQCYECDTDEHEDVILLLKDELLFYLLIRVAIVILTHGTKLGKVNCY